MRKHEERAIEDGVLVDTSHGAVPGEADQNLPTRKDGRVSDLVVPVATLIGVTVIGALWIGISNTEGAITPMQILANNRHLEQPLTSIRKLLNMRALRSKGRRTTGGGHGAARIGVEPHTLWGA